MKSIKQILPALIILLNPLSLLAQETLEFGQAIPALSPSQLNTNLIPLIENELPDNVASDVEVILISGYEASDKTNQGTIVNIIIDRPKSNILLILTSYRTVTWKVEVTLDTRINAILVGGHGQSNLMTNVVKKGYKVSLSESYKKDSKAFLGVLKKLKEWFNIEKIDAFRGDYRLDKEIKVTNLDRLTPDMTLQGYTVQDSRQPIDITLLDSNLNPFIFTQDTFRFRPNLLNKGAILTNTNIYRIADNGIEQIDKETKQITKIPLAINFPIFSWPSGIAWDSKRNIITVVTFGGEGFLYRYDINKQKWIDVRSLNNLDINYLTYDDVADRYIGIEGTFSVNQLVFISPEGDFLFKQKIDTKQLSNYSRVSDDMRSGILIIAKGEHLVLMQYADIFNQRAQIKILNIWDYDLNKQQATLIYKTDE